jgi:hypothetical protein
LRLPAFRFLFYFVSFVARVSEAKPGISDEAGLLFPDVASLIRATSFFLIFRALRLIVMTSGLTTAGFI